MFTQLGVRNDFLQVGVLAHICSALAGQHEGELLEGDSIGALFHKLRNELSVVHFLGYAHRLGIVLELAVDVEGRAERLLHLLGICGVV